MNRATNQLIAFAAGLAWATLASVAAADDTELFVGNALSGSQAKPNILFIIDDSISMDAVDVLTQNNYNPAGPDYPGACNVSRVYWSNTGVMPTCGSNNYFNMTALMCKRAIDAFAAAQGGVYASRFAQFNTGNNRWETISAAQKARVVECQPDRPDAAIAWAGHGSVAAPTPNVYARNNATNWSANALQEVAWASTGAVYTLYSGDYLNWAYTAGNLQSRISVMREVASNIIQAIDGVNVGLMHFNDFSGGLPGNDGAEVMNAMQDVTASRAALLSDISTLLPENSTPLEESLYEAYLYMTGGLVNYGTGADPAAYVAGSSPLRYESPMDLECQKNHIVVLTDGEPRDDQGVSASIRGLVDAAGDSFVDHIGSATCDLETYPPGFVTGEGGDCFDELAEFMFEGDLSPLAGQQNITTHTVGFRVDTTMLSQAAARGGGQYYTANNTAELTNALLSIITSVLDTQTTFLAPTVSVNSFNQTRNLDDLYFSVFRPTATAHWPGNLKKYKLRGSDGTIVDALDNPAIDPATGFFAATAQSIWSAGVDGEEVDLGGAANLIPGVRNVYTFLGNAALTHASNAVIAANAAVDNTMLNVANVTERANVLAFINGLDMADLDDDGVTAEPRYQMGDPLHAQPISVVYGPATTDARIYFATNDGFLHSIHANTGIEQWAFVPKEFLDNQVSFMKDIQVGTGSKTYGIDGNMRVQLVNANSDGVIGPGEKVFLFLSMRRGGDVFYALDITNPSLPRVMWKKDGTTPATTLPGIGQGFSSAMPARILVGSGASQNADRTVVVIGGGYDTTQDTYTANTDNIGNSIYIVDSENGTLLWHGSGNTGMGNKLFQMSPVNPNRGMNYSIPGDVRVLDLNGDGLADRMYAADQGGQVWRFDVKNGQPAASLVDGGIIAQLGPAGIAVPTLADTRRFYYAPDVAFASTNEFSFLHIGIGSGYREHPNETDNHNAFYALRDYKTFASMTQAEYDALVPTRPGDVDFINVTSSATASVPQGMKGWYLDLTGGGGWNGEKVLAETRTFNNRVFVTTFRPGSTGTGCTPALGTNRQYVMSLFTGAPVHNRDGSPDTDPLSIADRYTEWAGAPPPETIFIYTNDGVNSCVGTECGLEDFPDSPIRTFWSQESIE